MLLVSEDMLNAYKQQQLLTPLSVKKMTALDEEMDTILQRNDINEVEKAKLYQHALSRFLVYHDQAKEERNASTQQSTDMDDDEEETPIPSVKVEEEILTAMPRNLKRAATSIIQWMKMHPSKVSWDEMGRLLIGKKIVPNTNIIDLVFDAVNVRAKKIPKGSQEFYKALKDINISEAVIKNKKRLQLIGTPVPSRLHAEASSSRPQLWTSL